MKIQWKKLIPSILIPLAVGGLSALVTRESMEVYKSIQRPPMAPPGWLFPIVWSILFILMGVSAYRVAISDNPKKRAALWLFGVQLAVNFVWPILFFNLQDYLFAFFWLCLLWVLILTMIIVFSRIDKAAGYLQIPYLLWVTFAGYLNLGVYLLNR